MSRRARPSRDARPQDGVQPQPGPSDREKGGEAPSAAIALQALIESEHPMTARELGERLGIGRHEARRLLTRLLDAEPSPVLWTSEGWTSI